MSWAWYTLAAIGVFYLSTTLGVSVLVWLAKRTQDRNDD